MNALRDIPVSTGELSPGSTAASPRLGRRERNKREKLERIVAVSRTLFREQGYAQTTTQQIAEAADIGTGTLFLYVKSKDDLLVLVFRDEMLEIARKAFLKLDKKQALLDQLMQVFSTMLSYHERDPSLSRILLKEVMFPSVIGRQAEIQGLLDLIFKGLADLVVKDRKARRLKQDVDPMLVAENVFANYFLALLARLGARRSRKQFLLHLRQMIAITIS